MMFSNNTVVSSAITMHRPRRSTLFPYTTLFRSDDDRDRDRDALHVKQSRAPARDLCGDDGDDRQRDHERAHGDRKSTRLNSSHRTSSDAVSCSRKQTYAPPTLEPVIQVFTKAPV